MNVEANPPTTHGVATEETSIPCDHDWKLFDKPTNGGFGTAQAVGWECALCKEVQTL